MSSISREALMKTASRTDVLGTLLLCAMCASNAPRVFGRQGGGEAVPLESGRRIERDLKGGETHAYSVRLEAWQYAYVVANQKGVDVVVRLFDPSGAMLDEVDSPNGANGPEPVKWVAQTSGTYRIEVLALEKGASGTYEMTLLEMRAATEVERRLVEPHSLDVQVKALSGAREYDKAIQIADRAATLYENVLGPDDPQLADALDSLSSLYREERQYAKAEPLRIRALAIREKALGPDDLEVAGSLNRLAVLYNESGQYTKAEPLYVRSLAIFEKARGPEAPDVALELMDLAFLYADMGQFAKAEPLLIRALAIREKALAPDDTGIADSLNNLASLYDEMGQYAKAEPLFLRSLAIKEASIGPESSGYGSALANLGTLYDDMGLPAKAEPFFIRALAIYEKVYGPDHLRVALTVNNLATVYRNTGQYSKAEPLYLRSIAFYEKTFGPEHPRLALVLHNLATLYAEMGETAKAEPLFLRALAIREKALGPENPEVARTLNQLAALDLAKSDLGGALGLRARAGDVREAEVRHNLTSGSVQAKRLYLAQTQNETDLTLTIQAACAPTNSEALRVALTQVLRRKGRALDALVDQLDVLARSGSAEDRRLLGDLAGARTELAGLTLRQPGREGIDQHLKDVAEAVRRVDDLEAKASAQSSRMRAELGPITFDAVRAAIPAGATLVEFATYRPYEAKARTYGGTRYVVYTLTTDGTVRWADLGEAAPIEAAVAALRDALRSGADGKLSEVEKVVKPRARALDTLVFAPVRGLLGASTRLLMAPDGQLSLVPFDALVDENGRYATERYEISNLTSGRDLLRLATRGESRQPSAIIANPNFGSVKDGVATERLLVVESRSQDQASATTADVLARAYFPPLPGTKAEAEALPRLLPGARVLTGEAATKQALTALSGPRVLHLATHGFFLAGAPKEPDSRAATNRPDGGADGGSALALGPGVRGGEPARGRRRDPHVARSGRARSLGNEARGAIGV